jgi:hypothetical protein
MATSETSFIENLVAREIHFHVAQSEAASYPPPRASTKC